MQSLAERKKILSDTLKNFWGYDEFRDLQMEIIISLLEKKDILALLPTGGGKSLCYQLPALVSEGVCLVISPLLALMKDQVLQLKSLGIEAEYLSSELDDSEQEIIYEKAIYGDLKILYISPERLTNAVFLRKIMDIKLSSLAVDEAHCISEWGQDFRPSYQHIKKFREQIPYLSCLALTATATPKVVSDIKEKLGFEDFQVFQKSYKRNNLQIFCEEISDKYQRIYEFLKINKNSGIIYVRTRKEAEELTGFLKRNNIKNVDFYHAGLTKKDKNERQRIWQNSSEQVLVSTNAFGMGIDKDNVRFVMHFSPPASLENYYQEIGRAGRDGKESATFLFWNQQENKNIDDILIQQTPSKSQFLSTISYLYSKFQIAEGEILDKTFQLDLAKIQNFTKISYAKIRNILGFLHNQEIIYWNNYRSPSTLELKISVEEIEFLSKKEAYFIEILYRNLPGIGTHKVFFNEITLCEKLAISSQDFKERIFVLEKKEWVTYVDGNSDSVKFIKERNTREIQGKYWNLFEQIQKNKLQKWEEMKYFVQDKDYCKMRMILAYFGEKESGNCGKCSFCLSRNALNINSLSDLILQKLQQNPATFEQIRVDLFQYEKEKLFDTLISLLNLGKIKMLNYKTYTINE